MDMARLITTIGIRPELMSKYEEIRKDSGNFSDWVCQRIERWDEDPNTAQKRIDALKRQLTLLRRQFKQLADHNGVVRGAVKKNKEEYSRLLDIIEGEWL